MEYVNKAELADNMTFFRDEQNNLVGAIKITDLYKADALDITKAVEGMENKIMAERLVYRRKTEHDEAIKIGLDIALAIIEEAKEQMGV